MPSRRLYNFTIKALVRRYLAIAKFLDAFKSQMTRSIDLKIIYRMPKLALVLSPRTYPRW